MGHWEKKDSGGAVPVEIKQQFEGLQKLLGEIRGEQKSLDAEVKKKGAADVVLAEKVGRMDKGFADLKADVDALFKRSQRPLITVDAKTAAEQTKADAEIGQWLQAAGVKTDAAAYRRSYKAAFEHMVRSGDKALSAEETKTLSVGSAPDGGFWVEPARSDVIVTRLRETSNMRKLASVVSITSNSFKIPVDRDDVGYAEVGEQSSRGDTTSAQIGEMEIPVHEMEAAPKVTQNMLDDGGFDIEGWINQKVIDRFARRENYNSVKGNGVRAARGFLTGTPVTTADATRAFGVLQYIATGASGAFATASATVSPADKLLDLVYAFSSGYRANLTWAGNRTTLGAVRKFKDQNGNYIYDPRLGAGGIVDMVLGYPWEEFADMDDFTTANAFAIAVGDWKRGYQIVDRQGIRQLRDPLTNRPYVKFITTNRMGCGVFDSDAIKLLKFGTS